MLNMYKSTINKFDKVLFVSVLLVLLIGLFVLYSASSNYQSRDVVVRQLVWILVGLVLLCLVLHIDYQRVTTIFYLLYAANIVFLVLVLFLGKAKGGAHRWITIGAFNFQPSELVKITLVLALSSYIWRRRHEVAKISFLLRVFALALPAFFLILVEPDLGTALLLIPVILAMLFIAGAKLTHLFGITIVGIGSFPIFWHFLRDYQKQRLLVFINPNIDPLGSGYTIIQSKIALGSGGLIGKGWLSGTQNQLNFLPERHTDFIFSVVGEEWGFLGALFLIFLYFLIVYRGTKIMEASASMHGRVIAAGFITLFALQVIINIGMTIGFLPVVGLTLPLISYGGSSLITTLMALGFLLNVGMKRSLF